MQNLFRKKLRQRIVTGKIYKLFIIKWKNSIVLTSTMDHGLCRSQILLTLAGGFCEETFRQRDVQLRIPWK